MAKFIQVCASQDDLFALDEEGDVYHYNFNTRTWVKLVPRSHQPLNSRDHEASSLPTGTAQH